MGPQGFTADELARRVSQEVGREITGRTVYYYRSKGLISPCAIVGSQMKFTERHVLEMKAVLALQATTKRPKLDEIGDTVRGMTEDQLVSVSRSATRYDAVASGTAAYNAGGLTPCAPAVTSGPPGHKTVRVSPSVCLLVSDELGAKTLGGLIEAVQEYLSKNTKEEPK